MQKLIDGLFPMGHRKLIVSLIAVLVGVGFEKLGGGLSDNMTTALIAIVGIFTGGNLGEHFAEALQFLKGTKAGEIIEDVLPGDQGLGSNAPAAPPPTVRTLTVTELAGAMNSRLSDLENKLAIQAQNTSQIVQILTRMRNGNVPAGQTQPTAP